MVVPIADTFIDAGRLTSPELRVDHSHILIIQFPSEISDRYSAELWPDHSLILLGDIGCM